MLPQYKRITVEHADVLLPALAALAVLAALSAHIGHIGGIAYGAGIIDSRTVTAIGMTGGGAGSIVTGLEMAGAITASTAGAGIVVLGAVVV